MKRQRMKKKSILNFINNLVLCLCGSSLVFSGILIQLEYHFGHDGKKDPWNLALGLNHGQWADLHIISSLIVSLAMIVHIYQHWPWYKSVLKKRTLIVKNQQVIVLSIIFLSVALTGFTSWFIWLAGGTEINRKLFMEIHDKIAWALFLYLLLHVWTRVKWFFTTYEKLKMSKTSPQRIKIPSAVEGTGEKS